MDEKDNAQKSEYNFSINKFKNSLSLFTSKRKNQWTELFSIF